MRSLVFLIRDILIILIYRIFCHYDIKILIKSSAIQNNLVISQENEICRSVVVNGREIEMAVMGNLEPVCADFAGEILRA